MDVRPRNGVSAAPGKTAFRQANGARNSALFHSTSVPAVKSAARPAVTLVVGALPAAAGLSPIRELCSEAENAELKSDKKFANHLAFAFVAGRSFHVVDHFRPVLRVQRGMVKRAFSRSVYARRSANAITCPRVRCHSAPFCG